jgi:hypothetical protein
MWVFLPWGHLAKSDGKMQAGIFQGLAVAVEIPSNAVSTYHRRAYEGGHGDV